MTKKVQSIGLKHKNIEELLENLLSVSHEWSEQERIKIELAYELASAVHRQDRHRDMPYIYHPLRVANRIVSYLHVYDHEVVEAALMHDCVEDHPETVLSHLGCAYGNSAGVTELKDSALRCISSNFSVRVGGIVAAVTSPDFSKIKSSSYDGYFKAYANQVSKGIITLEGWLVKFSDWCDNGVGIKYADSSVSEQKIQYYKHKYGMVITILEDRFLQPDLAAILDVSARDYVRQQIQLARKRLE